MNLKRNVEVVINIWLDFQITIALPVEIKGGKIFRGYGNSN